MTDTNIGPQAHSSVVGGSTAARRLGCPASYRYEKLVPKDPGNEYARAGTAMHELMAKILDGGYVDELVPFMYQHNKADGSFDWGYSIDEYEWAELGEPALDAFDEFASQIEAETGQPFEFILETSCEFPGIAEAFGTSDVIWRCGPKAGVWDWKFGRSPVAATRNSQLAFYAKAAMHSRPEFFASLGEGETLALSICQPRCGDGLSTWWTTKAWLDDYALDLQDAVQEALSAADPHTEKGPWCQFATCRAVCPLHAGAVAELGRKLMAAQQAGLKEVPGDDNRFEVAEHIAEAMSLSETVQAWLTSIAKTAQTLLENGTPVPGWKLVEKRSSGKEWVLPEAKVMSRLRSRGLKTAEIMAKKLVSPTQAEKLLKPLGKELPEDAYQQKASSGHTLAHDSDERPSAVMPHEKVTALAERLADMATSQIAKG